MFLGGDNLTDLPVNAHGNVLNEANMTYVAYPPPDLEEVTRYTPRVDTTRAFGRGNDACVVFVGQIPKLLPLNYVPWALDLLMEDYGTRWVLQTQSNGCAKAWLESSDQAAKLVACNKLMLFDVCGLWIARTGAEIKLMRDYQHSIQSIALDSRVTRHGAIIERVRPAQSTGGIPTGAGKPGSLANAGGGGGIMHPGMMGAAHSGVMPWQYIGPAGMQQQQPPMGVMPGPGGYMAYGM